MKTSGFAFHCHHDVLCEWVTDYDQRVQYIKKNKPEAEQELRLRLFRIIPVDRLPSPLVKAGAAYDKAWTAYDKTWAREKAGAAREKAGAAYDKAWAARDMAWAAYDKDLQAVHSELCPDCSWNGYSIFPK